MTPSFSKNLIMEKTTNIRFRDYILVVTGDFIEGQGGLNEEFIPDDFEIKKVVVDDHEGTFELEITDLLHEETLKEIKNQILEE